MNIKLKHWLQKKNNLFFVGIIIVAVSCIFIGYAVGSNVQQMKFAHFLDGFKNIRENSDKYTFINPLIGGISPPATDVGLYSDVKEEIIKYLKQAQKKGDLYEYSFYFRDFNTGLWYGDHEVDDFFPASLFKLPIAIATYKQIEENPSFANKYVVYTDEIAKLNSSIISNSESSLEIGKAYSITELVEIMLRDSDNGAKNLLLSSIDIEYLNQLFSIISLVDPRKIKTFEISSRKYALFFRVLYGSSYLNEEHSELILTLLSKTTFKDGLVAGLPQGVRVSHKYGAYEFDETVNGVVRHTQQLHDCGVVYHMDNPYVFCLMTKGKDLQSVYKVISTVSKIVFDYQEEKIKE